MRYVFLLHLSFSFSLLLAFPFAFAADNPYAQLTGAYVGEVFNGADLDPVITTFTLSPSGAVAGTYVVDEESGEYSGSLSNVVFEDAQTITLEWTDKFGEGFAVMEFSNDFKSFAGEWTSKNGTDPLPWNGKK